MYRMDLLLYILEEKTNARDTALYRGTPPLYKDAARLSPYAGPPIFAKRRARFLWPRWVLG